jgi:hypothetical protein
MDKAFRLGGRVMVKLTPKGKEFSRRAHPPAEEGSPPPGNLILSPIVLMLN